MSINTSGDCRYALEALSSSCWSTEPCSCDDTPRYFKGSANCSSILFQPWKAPLGCSHPHHSVSQNYQKLVPIMANSSDHGPSISGYAMMLGNGCFSWSSKKQTATALSTGEAEYYATTHAGREILWLQQLLAEIGFSPSIGTTLHVDNTSSICMIETPDQVTNRTKHINIAYHWIHEDVLNTGICTFGTEHI